MLEKGVGIVDKGLIREVMEILNAYSGVAPDVCGSDPQV
jgi:hypothetical protein